MGDPTARQWEVPRQLRKLVRGAREQFTRVVLVEHGGAREVHEITLWCTRLQSGARARVVHDGARDCGVVHDGTQVEVPTARQQEVPRQLRKLVSGAREWYE